MNLFTKWPQASEISALPIHGEGEPRLAAVGGAYGGERTLPVGYADTSPINVNGGRNPRQRRPR